MSIAAASRRKTIPMNSAMYESVWVSEMPERSCRATMTVKMLNHRMPTISPPIASAAIELLRGGTRDRWTDRRHPVVQHLDRRRGPARPRGHFGHPDRLVHGAVHGDGLPPAHGCDRHLSQRVHAGRDDTQDSKAENRANASVPLRRPR